MSSARWWKPCKARNFCAQHLPGVGLFQVAEAKRSAGNELRGQTSLGLGKSSKRSGRAQEIALCFGLLGEVGTVGLLIGFEILC